MQLQSFVGLVFCLIVINAGMPPLPQGLRRVFRDDFNTLNKAQWVPDVRIAHGIKNQFQIYSPDARNCYAKGGKLYLRPTLTKDKFNETFLHNGILDVKKVWGKCQPPYSNACYKNARTSGMIPPIMSCHLRSRVAFKYGRLEIVAQMPRGDWLWPGLWLLPKTNRYGAWPRGGEIDLAETSGNQNLGNFGVHRATASLIFGKSREDKRHPIGVHWIQGTTYGHGMHKYTLDWTRNAINVYVDNVLIKNFPMPSQGMHRYHDFGGPNIWGNSTNAPYDQEFYVIMNVASGGTMFPDRIENSPYPKPWKVNDSHRVALQKFWNKKSSWYPTWNGENAAMKVDSVTIWSY